MTVVDFTAVINSMLPEPQAGLLNGMLFGTKTTLSRDLYDALVKTGTLHIIALSGMNITILTNLISITLLRFISRRLASLLTIVIIIGFILFVGPSPSVIRAGIMGGIALLAVALGRQAWSILSLALAASIMLIAYPSWIADIGFQLSVGATIGIILFGKKLGVQQSKNAAKVAKITGPADGAPGDENFLGTAIRLHPAKILSPFASTLIFIWPFIEDDLRVTLAAQIFTIPLILFHFHRMSLISPLTNILVGWTIAPITVLGLIATLAGFIWLPLGTVIGWVVWVPLTYLVNAVWFTSTIPFASLSW